MTTSARLTHHSNNTCKVTTYEETPEGPKKIGQTFLDKYVVKDISTPKPRFRLSNADHLEFVRALETKEGREIVNNLKNEHADGIINDFFKPFKKSKPITEVKLVGRNRVSGLTLGLTKKEIWEAFVSAGIVTPSEPSTKIII